MAVVSAQKLAANQTILADRLGRSCCTISRWIQRPDWPFRKDPPWVVDDVRTWARKHRRGPPIRNPAANPPETTASIEAVSVQQSTINPETEDLFARRNTAEAELKIHRSRLLELDVAEREGKLVARGDLDRCMRELAELFVHELTTGLQSLPTRFAGRDSAAIEAMLDDWIGGVRDRLAVKAQTFEEDQKAELNGHRGRGRPKAWKSGR